jgi:hypothetical protein
MGLQCVSNIVPVLDLSGTISDLNPKKMSCADLATSVRFGQQPLSLEIELGIYTIPLYVFQEHIFTTDFPQKSV